LWATNNFNLNKIDILLPPAWSGVYLNTARLLKYSLEDNGMEATIIVAGEIQNTRLSIVLGWNLIPNEVILKKPYVIYQLEPLVLPVWQDKLKQKKYLFENALAIWDYSEVNIKLLHGMGFLADKAPLGYHPKLEEVSVAEFQDYDVLFVGFLTERRKKIIEELQQHCCVSVQPRWGIDFLDALGRSKILLNLHQYEVPTPIEQPRISYALNNHAHVISENSTDNPYKNLITCDYENIITTVLKFLYHPVERAEIKDKVFNNFKEIRMESIVSHCLPSLMQSQ
jgi:hypothetical protein